jgi:hypothetical protein
MHSRLLSFTAIAALSFAPFAPNGDARAADPFAGQEVLVECPSWEWAPSQIPGVSYEICFNDIEHCAEAAIGDAVCIPSLGDHDVWVTAIDVQNGEPVYYDGDVVSIQREVSSDFTGDGVVGFTDMSFLVSVYGDTGSSPADLDQDGIVGFLDFSVFATAYGKCVNASGTIYERC